MKPGPWGRNNFNALSKFPLEYFALSRKLTNRATKDQVLRDPLHHPVSASWCTKQQTGEDTREMWGKKAKRFGNDLNKRQICLLRTYKCFFQCKVYRSNRRRCRRKLESFQLSDLQNQMADETNDKALKFSWYSVCHSYIFLVLWKCLIKNEIPRHRLAERTWQVLPRIPGDAWNMRIILKFHVK